MKDQLTVIVRHSRDRAIELWSNVWQYLSEFATAESARALADASEAPEVTFRRMGRIIVRALPFMRPMLPHIAFLFILGFLFTFLFTFSGTISHDMWQNKLLVGEKLQPVQAWLILVDDSYVIDSIEDEEGEKTSTTDDNKLTPEQRRRVRNGMFVWFAIGGLFGIATGFILPYYGLWVWQNVNQYLRVAMMERLEYLSLSFHHSNRSGDAIYRIYQDSSMIVNVLEEALISPMEILRGLIIASAFVLMFDPFLMLAVVAVWVPMALLTIWVTPRIRRRSIANRVANSDLTSRLQETFASLKVVKATRSENIMLKRFQEDSKIALDAAFHLRFEMVLLSLVVMLLGGALIIGLEYLMVSWVIERRNTMLGAWAAAFISFTVWNLGAFESARGRTAECVRTGYGIVRMWCMLQDLFIGLERAFYFLDLKPEVADPESPEEFPRHVSSVTWQNVHFKYPESGPVLRGVDLKAEQGTITALVGATGSGKSTLMATLLRLYDVQQGSVQINEQNVRTLRLDDIRRNTAIAMQKNVLFTGQVTKNIGYAVPDATREQIVGAAKIACADEFIQSMGRGYESELGERGSKLSAGQRQRLTIARAVIRDTAILILDEPTASLDAITEHAVLANLAEWGKQKIVFLITHRLSTIRNADQIAFLEDGIIKEHGSHEELIAKPDGHYRSFVEAELQGNASREPVNSR